MLAAKNALLAGFIQECTQISGNFVGYAFKALANMKEATSEFRQDGVQTHSEAEMI